MERTRAALALLAIFAVAGVIVVFASQTTMSVTVSTRTERFTTTMTVYENVEVVGSCTAVSYDLPDVDIAMRVTVTVTSGNSTSYSVGESISFATTHDDGTQTYTTTSYANATSSIFATTSTSYDLGAAPSSAWTVTACTYMR
jgi:hypothetical protein